MNSKIFLTALTAAAVLFASSPATGAKNPQKTVTPDGTYLYAERDSCRLFLDIYEPAAGNTAYSSGKPKPTFIFMFGGGFVGGTRDWGGDKIWFEELRRDGYRVVSIDYRLGLKGQKNVGIGNVDAIDKAIHLAVEDLFSATAFLIDNADEFGIDPGNIVISGSSAGAISVLQAEYEIANSSRWASVLPEGFNYAAVVAFAGAILSRDGALKYAKEPCPMLMFHGTADKVVNYKQIRFFKLGWYGSSSIAAVCANENWDYGIWRFQGNSHEIANAELQCIGLVKDFLEINVSDGIKRTVDAKVTDPRIARSTLTLKELYN